MIAALAQHCFLSSDVTVARWHMTGNGAETGTRPRAHRFRVAVAGLALRKAVIAVTLAKAAGRPVAALLTTLALALR